MSNSHLDLLHHIFDELDFLLSDSATTNLNNFLKDEKSKRATVEQAKNYSHSIVPGGFDVRS